MTPEVSPSVRRLERRLARERGRRLEAEEIAERSTRQLYQAVQGLQRSNSDLERFAFAASHDLKEPIRGVCIHLQLFERKVHDRLDDEEQLTLTTAINEARRLNTMVDGLLHFARLHGNGSTEGSAEAAVCLSEVLEQMEEKIAESGARIEAGPLPRVLLSAPMLTAVFHNLLSNAIKFQSDRTPAVKVSAVRESGYWHLCVSDNGIGIDPAHHERIFEPLERLHRHEEIPGVGLGLSIVRSIVNHAGGRVWVVSSRGKGTAMHFTLPVATDVGPEE